MMEEEHELVGTFFGIVVNGCVGLVILHRISGSLIGSVDTYSEMIRTVIGSPSVILISVDAASVMDTGLNHPSDSERTGVSFIDLPRRKKDVYDLFYYRIIAGDSHPYEFLRDPF